MKVYGYLRTILIESWIGFPDFRVDFVDFWISEWISGFQIGFLDFKIGFLDFTVDFWISGFQLGFLDFTVDFWISVWISADGVRDFFRDGPLETNFTVRSLGVLAAYCVGTLPSL